MGLRQAFAKWLATDTRQVPGDLRDGNSQHGWSEPTWHGDRGQRAPMPDWQPEPLPPGPTAVVHGDARPRLAPVELPSFYRPGAATPDGPAPVSHRREVDREQLRAAWDLVSDRSGQLISLFYAELFMLLGHEAFEMFPPSMEQQRHDFGEVLVQWVLTDDPETMSAHLDQLGADHRKYAVEPRHYDVAGRALVNAFKTVAGPRLTPEMIEALTASYERLASTMIDAAMRRRTEPATWGARVIGHTRVADDFAIVTVQADSPYFFKPGQYLTLELASRPKLWRQMSIASAPRPDNTFDLHVRAVNATGVSGALVRHTRLGDRMRLGPPRGNDLVVEPGTVSRGLLCVASGTGAAPISAVVESVLNWPEIPEHIYAYVGGRTRLDVYPVQRLNELIRNHGVGNRAHVEPVLSDDPEFAAHHGRVESVVPRLHDWASLGVDVLIAGPASMMSATIANLRMAGVPRSRIHFDQYDAAA